MDTQRRKKVGGVTRYLTDLPDEIIFFILSFMTLREAGKTILLSRKWRDLWRTSMSTMPDLLLDDINVMEENFPRKKFSTKTRVTLSEKRLLQKERVKFARRVNLILRSHQTPILNSFSVRFHLSVEFPHEIDQWVQIALNKRATKLDINLSEFDNIRYFSPRVEDLYTFPNGIFTTESTPFVQYLSLSYGICAPLQDFSGISILVELRLERVYISDEVIGLVLLNSSRLEGLILVDCWNLDSPKIVGTNLKYLIIDQCYSLSSIEIDADNLITFEYYGFPVGLCFLNVPRLINVVIYTFRKNIVAGISYALGALSTDLPQIESLLLHSVTIEEKMVPARLPTFSNLKRLLLMVPSVKGSLFGFFTILQGATHLERFELHLPFEAIKKKLKKHRKLCTSPLLHLKQVIFSGLTGAQDEIDFAVHLISNAKGIKTVAILSTERYYHYETRCA